MKYILSTLLLLSAGQVCQAQITDCRMYILGHSLLDYRPSPAFGEEYTVPYWMHELAVADGLTYAAGGQYGFLPQHRIASNWMAQWGWNSVPGTWDSENEPFSAANHSTLVVTAGNFLQNDQLPNEQYFGEPGVTPISAMENIVDTATMWEPGIRTYIYENWPEMNPFTNDQFPPTAAQFLAYDQYTQGTFHDWWITLHDSLLLSRPQDEIKMIPVGPILGELITGPLLSNIPYTSLYVDADPHGSPSLYLLAAMTTYMAVYERQCPSITLPGSIHPDIVSNYQAINNFIWAELQTYSDNNGVSRVFHNGNGGGNGPISGPTVGARLEGGALYIDDDDGLVLKGKDGNCYHLYVDSTGQLVHELVTCP